MKPFLVGMGLATFAIYGLSFLWLMQQDPWKAVLITILAAIAPFLFLGIRFATIQLLRLEATSK